MKKWFRAKQYGWGWTPSSWQAWFIVFLWIIIYVLALINILEREQIYLNLVIIIISVALLILISWLTGEKPGWHWEEKLVRKNDKTAKKRSKK